MIVLFGKFVPESSRYLISVGKIEEAKNILKYIAKQNNVELPNEFELIKSDNVDVYDHSKRGNIRDIFKKPHTLVSIMTFIMFFMCVFGYFGISFVSSRFFENIDSDSISTEDCNKKPYFEVFITTTSEIPGLILGILLIDKIGRKNLMILTFGTFFISCILLVFKAIYSIGVLGLIFSFIARMNISLAFLTIYIYFSEYYPTIIRASSLGFASSLGRIAGILTSFLSNDIPVNVSMLLFGISGLIAVICCLFIPDTSNKSMSDNSIKMENKDINIESNNIEPNLHLLNELNSNNSNTNENKNNNETLPQ